MMPPVNGVRASRDLKSQLADLHVFFSEVQTEKEALANLDLFSPPSQRRRPRKPFLEPPLPPVPSQTQAAVPAVPAVPKAVAKPRELIFYKPKLDTGVRTPIEEANMLAQPLATPHSPSMQCSGNSDDDDSDGEEVTWSAEHARLVGILCENGNQKEEKAHAEPVPAVTATASDVPQLASPRLSGAPSSVIVPRCLEFGGCSVDSGDGTPKIAANRPAESAPLPAARPSAAALSRLKQRSVARQSDRLSLSAHRLKQITALKQRARLAAAASVAHSARPPRAPAPAATAPIDRHTPAARQPGQLTESALAPLGAAATRAAAATGDGTAPRPFLKRRSQAQPMQQMPDWSAVRSKTSSRLDSNLILRPKKEVAPPPAAVGSAPRPTAATAKKPWGSTRKDPSPYGSTSTRPLGATRAALGGTKPLSAAQRVARTTTFVAPPPVPAAPSCGPLGAAAAAQSHFTSFSGFSGGSSHRMGPSRGSAWDPRPGSSGSSGGGGTPLDDPLGPLVSQVEQLLSSMEKAIRR